MFRTRVSVGIDLGHSSVKIAMLGPNKRDVLGLMEAELLPGREFLEDVCEEPRVIETVRAALAPIADPKSKYRASLSASFQADGAVYRYLELPPLKKEQLETALMSAASKLLAYPLQDASITARPVPSPSQDGRSVGTFLMAFQKVSVNRQAELLKRCGLEIERLEAPPVALLRAVAANCGTFPGEDVALVHVGSRMTTLVVSREGNPYFAREFALGGSHFTYAFQMGAQSTWTEAEAYKRRYDVAAREVPIEPALTRWLDQVKRSLDSFVKANPELSPSIRRILLTGGSSAWVGLAGRMEQALKVPVEVPTWSKLAPPREQPQASFGTFITALGLALG